ncbi:rhamnogalacturonan acetylesterase [Hymenobacter citatus]|nr:rhamnogalacturonan acetylesterase [Hymenobacter citatus]
MTRLIILLPILSSPTMPTPRPRFRLLLSVLLLTLTLASFSRLVRPRPTLYLIGDSTVKNGKGRGDGGLWGWGNFLAAHFDTTRIQVENDALGGTSSRTFRTLGLWEKVQAKLQPGDYVMMQFGHNDSSPLNDTLRARGTIKGTGAETEQINNLLTKKPETVHSYGWYLRQFIAETRAKGATPIVCTLVPRNQWTNGKVNRSTDGYAGWAATVAREENVPLIDLNQRAAYRYDQAGEAAVRATYFNTTDHTHTIKAGARLNAELVADGIRSLKRLPLRKYLKKE